MLRWVARNENEAGSDTQLGSVSHGAAPAQDGARETLIKNEALQKSLKGTKNTMNRRHGIFSKQCDVEF